jgi:cell fate (sporulation/competence/biofilm development) regulator YmcA (YheA/YmcA/DUF963 family)
MLVAVGSVEAEHPSKTATREQILDNIDSIRRKVDPDPVLIEQVTLIVLDLERELDALAEIDLWKVANLTKRLIRSEKRVWDRLHEIKAFIKTLSNANAYKKKP